MFGEWGRRFIERAELGPRAIGNAGNALGNAVVSAVDAFTGRRVVLKSDASTEVDITLSLDHPAFRKARGHVRREGWAAFDIVEGVHIDAAMAAGVDARGLAVELLRALVHLHGAGFAHSDLKPANVLVSDRLRVIDLGLAVPLGSRPRGGTPGFVAPELAGGAGASVAADLFAFGAIFATATDALDGPDAVVSRICATCLRDDPRRRPASAESCLALLHASARPVDRRRVPVPEADALAGVLPRDGACIVVAAPSGYLLPHLAADHWRRGEPLVDLRFGFGRDPWVAFAGDATGTLRARVAAMAPDALVLVERASEADADARDALLTLATVMHTRRWGGLVVLDADAPLREALQSLGAQVQQLPTWDESQVRSLADAFGIRNDPSTAHAIVEATDGAPSRIRSLVLAMSLDPALRPPERWRDGSLSEAQPFSEAQPAVDPLEAAREAVAAGAGRRALGHLQSLDAKTRKTLCSLEADAHALAGELQRAVSLEKDPASAARRLVRADRLLRVGRFKAASNQARLAAEQDPTLQGEALRIRATACRERGELDEAERLAREPADHPWSVHLALLRSDIITGRGEIEEGLHLAEVALTAARDDGLRARAHARIAAAKAAGGDWRSARTSYASALELFQRTGDLTQWPAYVMNVATADHALGDLGRAIEGYGAASRLAERFERPVTLAAASTNLASLLLAVRAHDEARGVLARAARASDAIDYAIYKALCQLIEAELDGVQDPPLGAREALLARDAFDALGASKQSLEAELVALRFGAEIRIDRAALEAAGLLDRLWLIDAGRALREGHNGLAAELAERTAAEAGRQGARLRELEAFELVASARGGAEADVQRAQRARAAVADSLPPGLRARFATPPTQLRPSPMGSSARRILGLARRVLVERDVQRLYAFALDEAVALTGAERAFLIERVPKGRPRVVVARNIDREHVRKSRFRFSRSVAEKVLSTGEPFMTARAADDPALEGAGSVQAMGLRSILCVPIRSPDSVVAALYLDHRFSDATFGSAEHELLGALADLLGLAIENARLHAGAARRNEELLLSEQQARAESAWRAQQVARLESEVARASPSSVGSSGGLVARAPAMLRALDLVDRASTTDLTVLIEGESGTGKELVARRVHERSHRRDGPMLAVNCGALTETLLESELFGHVRGAFTDAVRDNPGLFRSAAGGTLLLDEIGEMPSRMQTRLLRVLQERRVRPVGSEREVEVDVRVVAATNRDLAAEVHAGRFRQDLFFRLAAVSVRLPPLRERPQVIPELVNTLLHRIADEPGMRQVTISRQALQRLMTYDWPGNVRELEQVLRRAILMADGDELLPEHVSTGHTAPSRRAALQRFDAGLVADALRAAGGNKSRAARALGVSRPTLYRWLDRYALRSE